MASTLSPDDVKLFAEPNYGQLVTLMPDGSPQVTPVWIDIHDGEIWINTTENRQKARNIRRDPRVAISVQDANDPYRYVQVRGRVTDMTRQGADEHIDALARKYLDVDRYPYHRPDEQRVIVKVEPEHVTSR